MFHVVVKKYGSLRVFTDGASERSSLIAALLPDPDLHLYLGVHLPGKGRSCVTATVILNGQTYLLKKYEYRNLWYGLRHLLKRSRALRVFRNQRHAWLSGISTPEPLACLEKRRFGLLMDCYVLYHYLPDSQTLKDCWEDLSNSERSSILKLCGEQLGLLHRCGITHGDSNWRNILVTRGETAGIVPWLVDFDGSIRPMLMHKEKFHRDVEHFLRDMHWRKLPDEDVQKFLAAWQASAAV